jgi:hypothetical protein
MVDRIPLGYQRVVKWDRHLAGAKHEGTALHVLGASPIFQATVTAFLLVVICLCRDVALSKRR